MKAAHARELVAALFGYRGHAALLAERDYPLANLDEARILAPDIQLFEQRRQCLSGLPADIPGSYELCEGLSQYLIDNRYFSGKIWLSDSLESYVSEVLLIEQDSTISDALSGEMGSTNASFTDYPYYEESESSDSGDMVVVTVYGKTQGDPIDDKPFCGDTINLTVSVTLSRIAGKRGFLDFDIDVGGSLDYGWADEAPFYDVPDARPKDQWVQMTGGFRIGETAGQFQSRSAEIHAIRNRIALGKANERDINRLSELLRLDDDFF
jgi:hypothetical protein